MSTRSAFPASSSSTISSSPTASPVVLRRTLVGGGGTGVRLQPTDADPAVPAASALAAIVGRPDLPGLTGRAPELFLANYSTDLADTAGSPGSAAYSSPILVWVVLYSGLTDLDPHDNAPGVGGTPAPVATYPGSDCDDVSYVDAGSGDLLRTDTGCPGMFAGQLP